MDKKAIVLLSGGVDSSTSLALMKSQGYACYALSIAYQQRHSYELRSAERIASTLGVVEHRVVSLDIGQWGGSSITDSDLCVPESGQEKPSTYVPARNLIFLSTAAAWAEVVGASVICISANQDDYTNYPDCRPEFFNAFELAANMGTRCGEEDKGVRVVTPLIQHTKSEIVQLGLDLGVDFSLTWSCYHPQEGDKPCLRCDACDLRSRAFADIGVDDPLVLGL
jgi:7-cyano-7-deazaguanine synthase